MTTDTSPAFAYRFGWPVAAGRPEPILCGASCRRSLWRSEALLLLAGVLAIRCLLQPAFADGVSECVRWSQVLGLQGTLTVKGVGDDKPSSLIHETVQESYTTSILFDLANPEVDSQVPCTLASYISKKYQGVMQRAKASVAYKWEVSADCPFGSPLYGSRVTSRTTIVGNSAIKTVSPQFAEFKLQLSNGTYGFNLADFMYDQRLIVKSTTIAIPSDCGGDPYEEIFEGLTLVGPLVEDFNQTHNIPLPAENFSLSLTGSAQFDSPTIYQKGNMPVAWQVNWDFRPVEDTLCDPCKINNASVIGIENQSLGEVVEVISTGFNLHYQSGRAAGRMFASQVAIDHARKLGGWTLSVHHVYDPTLNALYLGNGEKRDIVELGTVRRSASGQFLIASETSDEVYVFDGKGRHLQTRHSLTGATLYQFGYDAQLRLIAVTDGDGNTTRVERNTNGQPSAIVAPFGQRTLLSVDAKGYLAGITDPSGNLVKLTTSANGLLTSFTNARNKTSTFTYDDGGRLVHDEDAVGGIHSLTREQIVGNLASVQYAVKHTSGEGRSASYEVTPHPGAGEERIITDAAGLKTTRARNASGTDTTTSADGEKSTQTLGTDPRFGRSAGLLTNTHVTTPGGLNFVTTDKRTTVLVNKADPFSLKTLKEIVTINGRATTGSYDAATHTYTILSPAGRKISKVIDGAGRVTQIRVPGLHPVNYRYDANGRLANISQGSASAPRKVRFDYGSDGFLATVIDPIGRKLSYSRDAVGRVKALTLPANRTIGFSYDANGNPTAITPPGRQSHTFAYSAVDLLSTAIAPQVGTEPNRTGYAYNLDRQLTKIERPDGETITFAYDAVGRIKTKQTARGTLTYTYDKATGNLRVITAPENLTLAYRYDGSLLSAKLWTGPVAGEVTYGYDNDFRVVSIRVNSESPTTYTYDPDGLPIDIGELEISYDAGNGLLNGSSLGQVQDQWTYSPYAEPRDYLAKFNGNPFFSIRYTRDALGRISALTETSEGKSTRWSYRYDQAGRLASVMKNGALAATYTYDSNSNRSSVTRGATTVTAAYDSQDRLNRYGTATYKYTVNGELKSKTIGRNTTTYEYDALGNLTAVTLPDGTRIGYLIDGRNRRIGKEVNGNLVQALLYQDPLRPAAELDGNGQIVSRFVYAMRSNVPDYLIRNGATYRIITDHLGSPRRVVDTATGTVMQRIDYDEWGNVIRDTNPGFQPFGFAGGLYDRDTELVRFGARDYDAEEGRWATKDPVRFLGGSTNLYDYVYADPVNLVDPAGLYANVALAPGLVVGAEAGVATGAGVVILAGAAVILVFAGSDIGDEPSAGTPDPEPQVPAVTSGPHPASEPGIPIIETEGKDPPAAHSFTRFNPGRDCNGKCIPCGSGLIWSHPGNSHGSTSGAHYHAIVWDQDLRSCMCFPKRVSGPTPDKLK